MVVDIIKSIFRDYDVLFEEVIVLRGVFLIDKNMKVRYVVINDLLLGRNVDEMFCMVDVFLYFEEYGEVCLVGWRKGDKGMKVIY